MGKLDLLKSMLNVIGPDNPEFEHLRQMIEIAETETPAAAVDAPKARYAAVEPELPFTVGEQVFVRTVTHHMTGRITKITGVFITLEDAAWIPCGGRFSNFINEGLLDETEPVNCPVRVNTASIIDVYEWKHKLPRDQS